MTGAKLHIVGAGVAGLACAVHYIGMQAKRGQKPSDVVIYEAAPQAGGRCRSFYDPLLDHHIDNGNHLLLSGNWAVSEYLEQIGALDQLVGPDRAVFPFVDITSGEQWTVMPGQGRIPFWLFKRNLRVPDTTIFDYFKAFRLWLARDGDTLEALLNDGGSLFERFWEPLCLGVLNTAPSKAQAKLLWPVLTETFLRGEAACRPRVAKAGLSETFIDPAVRYLERHGVRFMLSSRLKGLTRQANGRVSGLDFGEQILGLRDSDQVVIALPPQAIPSILSELPAPDSFQTIINAHFKLPDAPADPPWVIGLTNALTHWVFVRGPIVSATISAANDLSHMSSPTLAARIWSDIQKALGLSYQSIPTHRIIREKRATFEQSPDQVAKRNGFENTWQNISLCGDWTALGLPCTIEGSIRSGRAVGIKLAREIARVF